MSRPPGRSHSSRTRTTTNLEREYTTALVEPPKKLHLQKRPAKIRNGTILEPEYNTVLIEPPKKPRSTGQWTRKGTTSKKQTHGKATPVAFRPRETKSRLDVIRIPCDGPPFRINSIPLIAVGNGGMDPKDCVPGEDWLGQFPNMWSLADEPGFNWRRRRLIAILAKDLGGLSVDETYLMYVCYEAAAGVPHNRYLEGLSGFEMFGESFLFKIHRDFDVDDRPIFRDMGPDSVRELERGGFTEAVVRKLLNSMTRKGDEGKG